MLPLDDGWALLLSVAKYYSPAGTEIQENGVSPTVEVSAAAPIDPLSPPSLPDESVEAGDRQLDRAIEILLGEAGAEAA